MRQKSVFAVGTLALAAIAATSCIPPTPLTPVGVVTLSGDPSSLVPNGITQELRTPAHSVVAGEATLGSPNGWGGSQASLMVLVDHPNPTNVEYHTFEDEVGPKNPKAAKKRIQMHRYRSNAPLEVGTYTVGQDFDAGEVQFAVHQSESAAIQDSCYAMSGTVMITELSVTLTNANDPVWYVTSGRATKIKMSFDVQCFSAIDNSVTPPVAITRLLTGTVDVHP